MLIILPPSESKRPPPESGDPLALDELSFPELNPTRERVIDALVETSASPDAFERLHVGLSLVDQVMGNLDLRDAPTQPAAEVYVGALHAGFGWSTLNESARRRAHSEVVIASALWGALRPTDRIPTYRLRVWASLIGIGRLEPHWRKVLPLVLAKAARPAGVVLDLRSPQYQAIGTAEGLTDRTITLRVLPEVGERTIGDVIAKRIRGQVARLLLECGVDPDDPSELAALISDSWPARLEPPGGPRRTWTLIVRPTD